MFIYTLIDTPLWEFFYAHKMITKCPYKIKAPRFSVIIRQEAWSAPIILL